MYPPKPEPRKFNPHPMYAFFATFIPALAFVIAVELWRAGAFG